MVHGRKIRKREKGRKSKWEGRREGEQKANRKSLKAMVKTIILIRLKRRHTSLLKKKNISFSTGKINDITSLFSTKMT